MTLRRVYMHAFQVRDGETAKVVIDNPGGFEMHSIQCEVRPGSLDAEFVVGCSAFHFAIPTMMMHFPIPIIPADLLPQSKPKSIIGATSDAILPHGSQISVHLTIKYKSRWNRFIGWFRGYSGYLVISGDNLYSAEDGVPVEVEYEDEG